MNARDDKRGCRIGVLLLAPLVLSAVVFAGPEKGWLERSVALHREGSYAGAATVLEAAIAAGHETPEIVYNLACAKAALGEEAEAERLLRRVDAMPGAGGKKGLSADARFNLGTLAYRRAKSGAEGDLANALDVAKLSERFFRAALDVDPRDTEAARSVEVVQRLIKELQDKLRQQQDQQDQQQEQQQQQNQQQQNQQRKDGEQGERSDQSSQPDQQEQSSAQQQNQQGDQRQDDSKKPEQPKSDDELARELNQLAEQQEKLADENKEGMKSGQQRSDAQRKQEDLSQRTGQTSQELAKHREGERDGEQKQRADEANRQLDEARQLQQKAEEQMDRGEHQDAAKTQQKAAEALKRAAEQMGKSGEGQPSEPTQAGAAQPAAEAPKPSERKQQDMTVAEILEKERREAAQRTLKAIRQRMGKARPADKDW